MSLDPMVEKYPNESDYIFAGNKPISYIDKNGLYKIPGYIRDNYPHFTKYVSEQLKNDLENNSAFRESLIRIGDFKNEDELYKFLSPGDKNGDGPWIIAEENPCYTANDPGS